MQRCSVKLSLNDRSVIVEMQVKRTSRCHMGVKLGHDYCYSEEMGELEMTTALAQRRE